MRREKPKATYVTLRGCDGLWQLEAHCGACGLGASCGPPVVIRTQELVLDAMNAQAFCEGVYKGKPDDRCNWPLSFMWLFVPLDDQAGDAGDPS